jgi:hypothetical protein
MMEQRQATTKVLEEQVRAVNQRREEEAAARKQEIEGGSQLVSGHTSSKVTDMRL